MICKKLYGPPGTGKTSRLIDMISQEDPSSTVFCSFTKAAAKEGASRIGDLEARTIHSLVYSHLGISQSQVMNNAKLKEFSKIVGWRINEGSGDIEVGDAMLSMINVAAARCQHLRQVYSGMGGNNIVNYSALAMFAEAYEKFKKKWGYVDFNDMLIRYITNPDKLRIKNLYVDEAQDLSPLQWAVINNIKVDKLVVAGDDDQSVFCWGGADPHGMDRVDGEKVILGQSYRLPKKIWSLSHKILKKIKTREHKEYRPRDCEGEIYKYNHMDSLKLRECPTLFLYRNHSVRWEIEEYLIRTKTPYISLGGAKGYFDNNNANAVRLYKKLAKGGDLSENQLSKLKSLATPQYKNKFNMPVGARLFAEMVPWQKVLQIPYPQMRYLESVNLESKPWARLSTIHSAKGLEADQVVLLTAQGNRTWENMAYDADSEHRVFYVAVTRAKEILHIVNGGLGYNI